jgi:threonine synthase
MNFKKTLTEYRRNNNLFYEVGSSISLSLLDNKTVNKISSSILNKKSYFDSYPNLSDKKALKELKEIFVKFLKEKGIKKINTDNVVVFRGSYDSYSTLTNYLRPKEIVIPVNISSSIKNCFSSQGLNIKEYKNSYGIPFSKPKGILNKNSFLYFNNMFGVKINNKTINDLKQFSNKTKLLFIDIDTGFITKNKKEVPLFKKFTDYLYNTNAICVYTLSKEFGLPGLRISFGITNKNLASEIERFQEKSLIIISDINLVLAKKAIETVKFDKNINELRERNKVINQLLKNKKVFYGVNSFFQVPKDFKNENKTSSENYAEYLLKEHKIAVRPGISYGKDMSDYVRIVSCLPKRELDIVIQKIKGIKINTTKRDINPAIKYANFLGIETHNYIDTKLKETPLVSSKELAKWIGIKNIYLKDETKNPTGTVKDRFAEMTFSYFKQNNIKEYTHSSAGNTATALARMTNFIKDFSLKLYIPEQQYNYHNFFKNKKIKTFLLKNANYDQASNYSKKIGGQKTLGIGSDFRKQINKLPYIEAYEQCYKNGYKFDFVCQSISSGTGLIGAHLASQDAFKNGWVDKIPSFCAFQSKKVNPVVACYKSGASKYNSKFNIDKTNTSHAFAIRRGNASSCYESMYNLIKETGGFMEDANEKEIEEAKDRLFKYTGINAGYTACVALAGLKKYAKRNNLSNTSALVMITGKDRDTKIKTEIDKVIKEKDWNRVING